uniref:MHC class I-like antigen recognition-like domain-containing protein n=1 Tax=Pseudonaja textilis TaxID=8673 RepID=A0A670ZQK0_PSETE
MEIWGVQVGFPAAFELLGGNPPFSLWGHCSLLGAQTEQARRGFEGGLDGRGEGTIGGRGSPSLPSNPSGPPEAASLPLSASSHSLKYFFTSVSDPSQGLPQFVTVGYVDGQAFVHYDSHSRRMQPRVSWIEKYVGKEDPQYWDRNTQISRSNEETFRVDLETAWNRYNQSEGE